MTLKPFFKRVGYCLIIGFLYSLTSMILNLIFKKPVDVLSQLSYTTVAGFIAAFFISLVLPELYLEKKKLMLLLWSTIYVIHVSNIVEYVFFSTFTFEDLIIPALIVAFNDAVLSYTIVNLFYEAPFSLLV